MTLEVKKIEYKDTLDFILNIHYAKRVPSISYAYGLYEKDELIGIVTYGSPASPYLCRGICGEKYKSIVLELNRLCLKYNRKNEASFLVSKSLNMLPKPKIVVSYADTQQGHLGVVYQASNFIFTGTSKIRTDIDAGEGKHSRHHLGDATKRKIRYPKHRYVYMVGNKYQKRELTEALKYPQQNYPKSESILL